LKINVIIFKFFITYGFGLYKGVIFYIKINIYVIFLIGKNRVPAAFPQLGIPYMQRFATTTLHRAGGVGPALQKKGFWGAMVCMGAFIVANFGLAEKWLWVGQG
jgi:hypothetical protein